MSSLCGFIFAGLYGPWLSDPEPKFYMAQRTQFMQRQINVSKPQIKNRIYRHTPWSQNIVKKEKKNERKKRWVMHISQ